MLRGNRILVAEDNDWIAAGLVETITNCHGIALGPARTTARALALIEEHPDGAILDGNLLDGPITPVACALCDRSVPLVVFTGLGLPADLQKLHPDTLQSFSSHHHTKSSFAPSPRASGRVSRPSGRRCPRHGLNEPSRCLGSAPAWDRRISLTGSPRQRLYLAPESGHRRVLKRLRTTIIDGVFGSQISNVFAAIGESALFRFRALRRQAE
jgi:hypothetical protein